MSQSVQVARNGNRNGNKGSEEKRRASSPNKNTRKKKKPSGKNVKKSQGQKKGSKKVLSKKAVAKKKANKQAVAKASKIVSKIASIFLMMFLVAVGCFGFIFYTNYDDIKQMLSSETIYPHILVNGIDIGGLSSEEAFAKLTEELRKPFVEENIIFTAPDIEQIYPLEAFGMGYDVSLAVEEAYNYAREGNLWERYEKVKSLNNGFHDIQVKPTYNSEMLTNVIQSLENRVNKSAVDATLSRYNGEFTTTLESSGQIMRTQETLASAKTLLDNFSGGTVSIGVDFIEPNVTVAQLLETQTLIGSFYTTMKPGDVDRDTNVYNALSKINDYILAPGETFSTNTVFGAMTEENGYRYGTSISDGIYIKTIGGGICQVSSTLYNTVLFAELPIVERRNHSMKVGYTDWGFDATLAENLIDFRFRNDTEYPIYIEGIVEEEVNAAGEKTGSEKIIVNMYGHEIHPENRTIKFSNTLVETIAKPDATVTLDTSLAANTRVVDTKGTVGYKYDVYKHVYVDGVETETVKINSSTYRATADVVRVGPTVEVETPAATPKPETTSSSDTSSSNSNIVQSDNVISTVQ